MDKFIASIEVVDGRSFRASAGTDEAEARRLCAKFLIALRNVRTVGLLRNGLLVDVFDGEWMTDVEDRYWQSMADECFVRGGVEQGG